MATSTPESAPKWRPSGDAALDAVLTREDADFHAVVASLPADYWARYDLSAVRIGWALARGEIGAPVVTRPASR